MLAPAQQAVAFGYFSLMWGVGSLVGPAIGGVLARPCLGWLAGGALCAPGALLQRFPYLLPCGVVAALSVAATVLTAVTMEESAPGLRRTEPALGKGVPYSSLGEEAAAPEVEMAAGRPGDGSSGAEERQRRQQGAAEAGAAAAGAAAASPMRLRDRTFSNDSALAVDGPADGPRCRPEDEGGEWAELLPGAVEARGALPKRVAAAEAPWYRQRGVVLTLGGYALIAFIFNILDELVPIYASAPLAEGGLGFSTRQLAPSLSFSGVVLIGWALWGFPWLLRRLGATRACRNGLWQSVPMALLIPAASIFGGRFLAPQAVMFLALGLKSFSATNAFTSCIIMVNASAPEGERVGCSEWDSAVLLVRV